MQNAHFINCWYLGVHLPLWVTILLLLFRPPSSSSRRIWINGHPIEIKKKISSFLVQFSIAYQWLCWFIELILCSKRRKMHRFPLDYFFPFAIWIDYRRCMELMNAMHESIDISLKRNTLEPNKYFVWMNKANCKITENIGRKKKNK